MHTDTRYYLMLRRPPSGSLLTIPATFDVRSLETALKGVAHARAHEIIECALKPSYPDWIFCGLFYGESWAQVEETIP